MEQQTGSIFFGLKLDETASGLLISAAKWMKFLCIVGFIAIALMTLGGIYTATVRGYYGLGSLWMRSGFVLVALAALYFFPTYQMFRFACIAPQALLSSDSAGISRAMSYLRKSLRFFCILMMISLGLYLLMTIARVASFVW